MKTLGLILILTLITTSVLAQGLPPLQKTWAIKQYEKIQKSSNPSLKGEINRVKSVFVDFWGGDGSPVLDEEGNPTGEINAGNPEDIEELANLFGSAYIQRTFGWHYKRQEGLVLATGGSYVPLVPPYSIEVREDGYVCIDGCPVEPEVDEGIYN